MENIRNLFLLSKDVIHLNHGSFGACPKPIFERYQQYQTELERNTVNFFVNEAPQLLKRSREQLADFIGCHANDVVMVMNPSYAINIVAKSIPLQEDDEVLTTDLEYGAMDFLWNYVCAKAGAKYVQQPISLPLTTKQQVVDEFFKGCTARTKVVFISHITSSTALILPVEEICAEAKRRGLITIVDGAHVPAHIPLDLRNMEADFYTGACHKWMLTPKGSSFLYVRPEFQKLMDPLVISWGFNTDRTSKTVLIDFHELQGTRDTSAFMTIPDAMDFRTKYDWQNQTDKARETVVANAVRFAEAANGQLLCPVSTDFLGQICSVKINCPNPQALKKELYSNYRIEIPVIEHRGSVYLRFSFQPYNTQQELETLFSTLEEIRTTTALLK